MSTKSKKRTPAHLPTYTYERTSSDGIRERLALASLAYSKTWQSVYQVDGGQYVHTVRFVSKTEGWEAHYMWKDSFPRINLEIPGVKRDIAMSIEGARARWFDDRHPSKELLAIAANVAARNTTNPIRWAHDLVAKLDKGAA